MTEEVTSTAPKPFVFVLMPFKPEFDDIYKFGIKGASEDAGAYSERVDEQNYTESMLDRIYNQINKADVIIADMTGQNPNVFYEVGYAHALNKIVLLLTQDGNDIPFDLKHRPHIVYGGRIEPLRNQLAQKLRWAINESRNRTKPTSPRQFGIMVQDTLIPEASTLEGAPVLELGSTRSALRSLELKVLAENVSAEPTHSVSHVYLLTSNDSPIIPLSYQQYEVRGVMRRRLGSLTPVKTLSLSENNVLPVQYRLAMQFPPIPSGAVEEDAIRLRFTVKDESELDEACAN